MAFGFDALWTVSLTGQSLQRIDPTTDAVTATVMLGKAPGFLAAGEGAVWVQEQGDGTLARVDPVTAAVSRPGEGRRQSQMGRHRHRRRQGVVAHDRRPDLRGDRPELAGNPRCAPARLRAAERCATRPPVCGRPRTTSRPCLGGPRRRKPEIELLRKTCAKGSRIGSDSVGFRSVAVQHRDCPDAGQFHDFR